MENRSPPDPLYVLRGTEAALNVVKFAPKSVREEGLLLSGYGLCTLITSEPLWTLNEVNTSVIFVDHSYVWNSHSPWCNWIIGTTSIVSDCALLTFAGVIIKLTFSLALFPFPWKNDRQEIWLHSWNTVIPKFTLDFAGLLKELLVCGILKQKDQR